MSKSQRKVVESNFSALRHSLIHGDIPEAIALMKNGALLHEADYDDHTALDQVSMSENHTLFLARGGKVYSCGRGLGGRLGLGTEENRPEPKLIPCFETTHKCVVVATGADHSLFLTESKMIFSCGRNEYGQLGCSLDTTDRVLTPREIQVCEGRGSNSIEGIACGPFHSIIYSSSVMYTFGRNEGQLGHKRGEEVIKEPKSEHPRKCWDSNQELDEENYGSHVSQSTMKKDMAFLLENAEELSPDIALIVRDQYTIYVLLDPPRSGWFAHGAWSSLADITLLSRDGKEFPCHKCILMARSEYFRVLFDSTWLEGQGKEKVPCGTDTSIRRGT
ncbi:unnamed protein product [Darwinula stevensoni]|uniref:BTB domain-containing protein n=1 Tax=Darwinula stevensoni TaxID=69355 RepID=A0A7R9FQM1_9CRUS|nr:unnamed protein product [Darwinula stevensoni]CAG0899695.1 unnamed protein product [Darwinula stevensoni]